jgi:hypothetical protein
VEDDSSLVPSGFLKVTVYGLYEYVYTVTLYPMILSHKLSTSRRMFMWYYHSLIVV